MVNEWLARLATLPLAAIYAVAGAVAGIENIFPPFPSDVVVAFAAFVSARAKAPFWQIALVTWFGNVAGAMTMYFVGRRYGSLLLLEQLERFAGKQATAYLQRMHARYGVLALFLSRFLPGVRAIVPPFAGAMQLPAWQVFWAMTVAGGIWYSFIVFLAYQAGERWETLLATLGRSTTVVGLVALAIAVVWGAVWFIRRRRASAASRDDA